MTECRQDTSEITVNVAGAHAKHLLMQWSTSGLNYIVATADPAIGKSIAGHLVKATQAAGKATIRMLNAPGTAIGVATGTITEGDVVTAAAAGLIASNGAGVPLGIALETVATGEACEYRPFVKAQSASGEVRTVGASTAAAGTTTADAGVLPAATGSVYPTSAADDTKGVRVHANDAVTGRVLFIGNNVSNKILKVYGPSGAVINGAAADAAFSSVSGKGVVMVCLSGSGNTWLAW